TIVVLADDHAVVPVPLVEHDVAWTFHHNRLVRPLCGVVQNAIQEDPLTSVAGDDGELLLSGEVDDGDVLRGRRPAGGLVTALDLRSTPLGPRHSQEGSSRGHRKMKLRSEVR